MSTRKKEYIAIIEDNEYEGERWRRWFLYKGNEAAIKRLAAIPEDQDGFTFDDEPTATKEEVDTLCKFSFDGYANYEGKFEGYIDVDKLFEDAEEKVEGGEVENLEDGVFSILYKCGMFDYMRNKPIKKKLPVKHRLIYLTNTEDNHNKFYIMNPSKEGKSFTVTCGAIGHAPTGTKEYPISKWDEKLKEKLNNDYKENKGE